TSAHPCESRGPGLIIQVFAKVFPIWIGLFNELEFPSTFPFLQLPLASKSVPFRFILYRDPRFREDEGSYDSTAPAPRARSRRGRCAQPAPAGCRQAIA